MRRLGLLAALALAACQPQAGDPGDASPVLDGPDPASDLVAVGAPQPGEERMDLNAQAAAAVADLAGRLGVDAAGIEVLEARLVTWPDSSLGCPEPGMMYLQVLTPGALVVLEAGGQPYRYHAGAGGQPFHCPEGRATAPLPVDDR
jgi:hypothetical protein